MHWNEKIALVKQKFSVSDFKDPFRSGIEISEKIISYFFKTKHLHFSQIENRETLLSDAQLLATCKVKELYKEQMEILDKTQQFWLFLFNLPMNEGFKVYDCKVEPIRELLYLSSGLEKQEFCIVHKKYEWLLFYKIDRMKNEVEIYQSVHR